MPAQTPSISQKPSSDSDRPVFKKNRARGKLRRDIRRVLHVSSSDSVGDAGRSAFQLHRSLLQRGGNSQMFVLNREIDDPAILHYRPDERFSERLRRMVRKTFLDSMGKAPELSDDRAPHGTDLWNQMPVADVVHLHSIAGFIDWRRFFPNLANLPVIWTIHDMTPFTGGCQNDRGCGRFREACGFCPQLPSSRRNDFSHRSQVRKQKALDFLNPEQVRIVAVSSWLRSAAASSSLFQDFDVVHIPHGIDLEAFRPRNRSALRAALGISEKAFVVLATVPEADDPTQRFAVLTEALQNLNGPRPVVLLTLGKPPHRTTDLPFQQIDLGPADSDDLRSLFYSAGDCFANAGLVAASDLGALEAMACETPVAAFDSGGMPDLVKPGETGLLAKPQDIDHFSANLQWLSDHPESARMLGKLARRLVEKEFSDRLRADRYAALYEEADPPVSVPSLQELCV